MSLKTSTAALLAGLAAVVLLAAPTAAPATDASGYPTRPITLLVPFAPGGGLDVLARALGVELEQRLGQPVIVENKPGAGSLVGTREVVQAAPDGHTLLVTSDSLVTNAAVTKELGFDPLTDLVPITAPYRSSYLLVTHPSVPADDVQSLIAELEANPGRYNYASAGIGGSPHLTAAYFIERTGVDIVHVPLRGSGPMVTELLSGRVQLAFLGLSTTRDHIADGNLKALAVTPPERLDQLPDVPTFAEAGVDDFVVVTWSGVFAPKGTPEPIIERLHKEISEIVQGEAFAGKLIANGTTPYGSTPEELGEAVRSDLALWREIVAASGIEVQ